MQGANRFLVVDPEQAFLKSLGDDPKARLHPPVLADIGSAALKALREPGGRFVAVLINLKVRNPDGHSVAICARQNFPSASLLLIVDASENEPSEDVIRQLRADGVVKKPFAYSDVIRQFLSPAEFFDSSDAQRLAEADQSPTGTTVLQDDQEFSPVPIDQYLSGSKAMFDLYIRLESGKYLKLLKVGDAFEPEQVANYKAKGLTQFHLRRETYEAYLAFTDKVVNQALQREGVQPEVKITQTIRHGQRVLDLVRARTDIKPAEARFAVSYVDKVNTLIHDLDLPNQSQTVREFLKSAESCDHAIGTTMLAGLLAREMGFETEKSARLIGLAAFLHDIALFNTSSPALQNEDESAMSPEEIKLYHLHPLRGASILSQIRGIDPIVAQAVANHHRRRDGTGFPNSSGLGMSVLTPPPEIVGLCDEFVRFQLKQRAKSDPDAKLRLRAGVFAHFSGDLVEKLCKILDLRD